MTVYFADPHKARSLARSESAFRSGQHIAALAARPLLCARAFGQRDGHLCYPRPCSAAGRSNTSSLEGGGGEDPMTRWERSIATALFLTFACGSRSGPFELGVSGSDAAVGGASGFGGLGAVGGFSGTPASGGVGAIGGSAGAGGADDCNVLLQIAPIVSVGEPGSTFDSSPQLTFSNNDDDQVTVVARRTPGAAPPVLRHATFHPWPQWPPVGLTSQTTSTLQALGLSQEFRISASTPNTFGLLAVDLTGLRILPTVSATQSAAGPSGIVLGKTPVFLTEGAAGLHLLGTLSEQNELYAQIVESAVEQPTISTVGCADSRIYAGAVRFGGSWLIAYSNGEHAPPAVCGSPSGVGEPTRIDVIHITAGHAVLFLGTLQLKKQVTALAVAPHPGGVYVVWREASGADPIRWTRFDATKSAFVATGEVSGPGEQPLEFSAAALGDKLVVAYGTGTAGSPSAIVLKVQDPLGNVLAQTAINPSFVGRPELIASSSHRSLLVGFREGGSKSSIDLARFDCAP